MYQFNEQFTKSTAQFADVAANVNRLALENVQIARTSTERSLGTAQEVFANTIKTNEAIGALAKGQFEKATAQAQAEVEKVTKAASKAK